MKPTRRAKIDDVAELAGVSIKTVSRVVNQEPNVRESTREKVGAAIAELNYRPNLSARSLASHRSHLVVLVYDDPSAYELPSSGYVIRMQQGAIRACRSANYEVLIHPCDYRADSADVELQAVISRNRPDGVILAAPLSNMPKIVAAIAATNTPYVRVSPGRGNRDEFHVATNDREFSAQMTEYLASLGHTRIAFITGNPSHKAVARRYLGYKEALRKRGIKLDERMIFAGDNSIGSGEAGATKLLALKRPPTAIFAANDDMAAGVVRVANRLGLDIPGQLSVAGCDDITLARQIYPSLTTVRQPIEKMAEMACKALIGHSFTDLSATDSEIISATLQIRESTGPAPQ